MKRVLLLTITVGLLLFANFAFCQDPQLTLNSPPSNNSLDGIYTGQYSFTNNTSGGTLQMTCDDFADEQNYNETNFNVTTGLLGSLSNTMYGNLGNAVQLYEEAAYLVLNGVLGNIGNTQSYYNYAVWAVFQPQAVLTWLTNAGDNAACAAVFGYKTCASVNLSALTSGYLYTAQQNYGSGNYSSISIYTPVGCAGTDGGACGGTNPGQEFIMVAEGGAALLYLLLAGLSCFGAMFLRRSRTRSANPQLI